VLEFPTEHQAVRFEKYLKTGSGRAFAARHFGNIEPTPTDEAASQRHARVECPFTDATTPTDVD
jgi:hypothetical protein